MASRASVDSAGIFLGFFGRHNIVLVIDEFFKGHFLHFVGDRHVVIVAGSVSFVIWHVFELIFLVYTKGSWV